PLHDSSHQSDRQPAGCGDSGPLHRIDAHRFLRATHLRLHSVAKRGLAIFQHDLSIVDMMQGALFQTVEFRDCLFLEMSGIHASSLAPFSASEVPISSQICYPSARHLNASRACAPSSHLLDAMRHFGLIFTLFFTMTAHAAMLRVVDIKDSHTVVVQRGAATETLTLAGIEITDELHAHELLAWTLRDRWVLAETSADGWLLYRSPDALFINRELVLRGY